MFEKELVGNHESIKIEKMKNFCDDPEQIGNKKGGIRWSIKTVKWQVKRNKVNYQKKADQEVNGDFYPNLPGKLGKANVWRRFGEKIGANQGENGRWDETKKGQPEAIAEIFVFFMPNFKGTLITDDLKERNFTS